MKLVEVSGLLKRFGIPYLALRVADFKLGLPVPFANVQRHVLGQIPHLWTNVPVRQAIQWQFASYCNPDLNNAAIYL
jgi:hypothetical protein